MYNSEIVTPDTRIDFDPTGEYTRAIKRAHEYITGDPFGFIYFYSRAETIYRIMNNEWYGSLPDEILDLSGECDEYFDDLKVFNHITDENEE